MKTTVTIDAKWKRSPETKIAFEESPGDALVLILVDHSPHFPILVNRKEAALIAGILQSMFCGDTT